MCNDWQRPAGVSVKRVWDPVPRNREMWGKISFLTFGLHFHHFRSVREHRNRFIRGLRVQIFFFFFFKKKADKDFIKMHWVRCHYNGKMHVRIIRKVGFDFHPPFRKAYAAMGKKGSWRKASQKMNDLNHSGGSTTIGSLNSSEYHLRTSFAYKKVKQSAHKSVRKKTILLRVTPTCWGYTCSGKSACKSINKVIGMWVAK